MGRTQGESAASFVTSTDAGYLIISGLHPLANNLVDTGKLIIFIPHLLFSERKYRVLVLKITA
jgi:hypothetical protein